MLLERFQRQQHNLTGCKFTTEMPGWVYFIVYGQFVLFSLFGLVPSMQVYSVLVAKHPTGDAAGHDAKAAAPPADSTRWALAAMAYSMLSVLAKTWLEFGFLTLVETLPHVD